MLIVIPPEGIQLWKQADTLVFDVVGALTAAEDLQLSGDLFGFINFRVCHGLQQVLRVMPLIECRMQPLC